MRFVSLIKNSASTAKLLLLMMAVVLLQACSGGSGGGDSGREGEELQSASGVSIYAGPAPANSDVQHFKTTFYDNVVPHCGSCHTTGGGAPTPFADQGNVNTAWNAAKTVADLVTPGNSQVVSKVGGGHNCWLASSATCAVNMQGYVQAWANGPNPSVSSVNLTPINPRSLAGLKVAPPTYADAVGTLSFDLTVSPELMYLLQTYCSGCHTGSSSTPQSPYFASSDPNIAYAAMLSKIDLANPGNSRLVVRLQNQHNCWSGATGCASDALEMENAIARFAADLPVVSVDPNLVATPGQILESDGIVASGGGRYDGDIIAKWEFREGQGTLVADTSLVQPEIELMAFGNYSWVGGWGVRLDGGHLQASVSDSAKLYNRLAVSGEYTIEAWVAPNNVTQQDAWIFGYAGGPTDRNLLLAQNLYSYDFYNRSTANPTPDAAPGSLTSDTGFEFAQATLQHVVFTFDPFNGRKIYVNGVDTLTPDAQGPGVLSNWSPNYALVLGSDFAGNDNWNGVMRMMAVHSKALSPAQILQNYNVGVGQKYFLMFNISQILNEPAACEDSISGANYCYIVFEVSQFDSTSYLFKDPRFVNINPNAASNPLNFDIEGIFLGMNGQLVRTGQGFVNLRATLNGSVFTVDDPVLQTTGTIVPLENGPDADVFFLAFGTIDGQSDSRPAPVIGAYSNAYTNLELSQIGMRTFDEINESYAHITGVPTDNTAVKTLFDVVRRSLPSTGDIQTYMASHQMAVMQLAAAYCGELAGTNDARRAAFFNDTTLGTFDFNASVASVADNEWRDQVVVPLIDRAFATGLDTAPTRANDGNTDGDLPYGTAHRDELIAELLNLIINPSDGPAGPAPAADQELTDDSKPDGLKYCNGTCASGRTIDVVKAVCTAVLSSAGATMK